MSRNVKTAETRYIKNEMNRDRAGWAMMALEKFSKETGQNLTTEAEEAIGDLLCDLGHLCAAKGFDYDLLVSRGREHFTLEAASREF